MRVHHPKAKAALTLRWIKGEKGNFLILYMVRCEIFTNVDLWLFSCFYFERRDAEAQRPLFKRLMETWRVKRPMSVLRCAIG